MSANASVSPRVDDLRTRRLALGLSQEALARLADCSTGYVRLLESGYRPREGVVVDRIEAALRAREIASEGADVP